MVLPPDLERACLALADPRSVRTARLPRPGPRDEAEFQAQVIAFARANGWERVYHTYTSKRSAPGFPDLVIGRRGRVIVAELKVGDNQPTADQTAWLEVFRSARVPAFCWWPHSWAEIERALAGPAAAGRAAGSD